MTSPFTPTMAGTADVAVGGHVSVDCPAPGVVLIEAFLDDAIGGDLHYRVGSFTKPPLDLWIRPDGVIGGAQFVLQDEVVPKCGTQPPTQVHDMRPRVDISAWPQEDPYLDVVAQTTACENNGSVNVHVDRLHVVRWHRVGEYLRIGFDSHEALCGVSLGPLRSWQWEMVRSCAIGPPY